MAKGKRDKGKKDKGKAKARRADPVKAAKSAKPGKLPKKIAGVKVPKELRAPAGRLLRAINNPLLVDAAAATLAAAATRLAQPRARIAPEPPRQATDLAGILSSLAIEGMRRLGERDGPTPRDRPGTGATPPRP